MSAKKEKAIEGLSFEQALAELENVVDNLEQGQVDLDKAISQYTRGVALQQHCERQLKAAQLKVEVLTKNAAGDYTTESLSGNAAEE